MIEIIAAAALATQRLHGANGIEACSCHCRGYPTGERSGPFGKRVVLQRTACARRNSSQTPDSDDMLMHQI